MTALIRKSKAQHTEEIRKLAQNPDWHVFKIAQKLRIAPQTVRAYAHYADIQLPRAPNEFQERMKAKRVDIIAFARENFGQTRTEIARRMGVSRSAVHRALASVGLPTMRQYDADGKRIDRV